MKAHGHGQIEAWVDLDSMDEPKLMATYFRNFDLDKNGRIDGVKRMFGEIQMVERISPGARSLITFQINCAKSPILQDGKRCFRMVTTSVV